MHIGIYGRSLSQTGPSVTCSQTHDMTTYLEDNTVTVNVKKTINNRIDVRPMRGLNIHVVSLEMLYSDAKHISCAIDSHRCLVSSSLCASSKCTYSAAIASYK